MYSPVVGRDIFNEALDTIGDSDEHAILRPASVLDIFDSWVYNEVEARESLEDFLRVGLQDEIFLITYNWYFLSNYLR